MARDIARIQLPAPPLAYDPDYERRRNARIEELIRTRAAVNELAPYGGIPHAQVSGTNATFNIPIGTTPTILPFNNVLYNAVGDGINFNTGSFSYSISLPMNTIMFFRLRHFAAAGGSVDFITTLFVNGVAGESYGYVARNDDLFDISDVFFPIVPRAVINLPITLRVQHNSNQPVTIDMTKSKWVACQLTPDPKYLVSETR